MAEESGGGAPTTKHVCDRYPPRQRTQVVLAVLLLVHVREIDPKELGDLGNLARRPREADHARVEVPNVGADLGARVPRGVERDEDGRHRAGTALVCRIESEGKGVGG